MPIETDQYLRNIRHIQLTGCFSQYCHRYSQKIYIIVNKVSFYILIFFQLKSFYHISTSLFSLFHLIDVSQLKVQYCWSFEIQLFLQIKQFQKKDYLMLTSPNINNKEENATVLKQQMTELKRQISISRCCFYHHEYKYDSKINLIYFR